MLVEYEIEIENQEIEIVILTFNNEVIRYYNTCNIISEMKNSRIKSATILKKDESGYFYIVFFDGKIFPSHLCQLSKKIMQKTTISIQDFAKITEIFFDCELIQVINFFVNKTMAKNQYDDIDKIVIKETGI